MWEMFSAFLWIVASASLVHGFSPSNWTRLIFEKFGGSDGYLDVSELECVVNTITNENSSNILAKCDESGATESECTSECVTLRGVYVAESWNMGLKLNQSNFEHVCPSLLYMLTQTCAHTNQSAVTIDVFQLLPPTQLETWGYGLLFTALVSLSTLAGAILVLPCRGTPAYDVVLTFLVALATGCLVSNSAFVLVPEAFEIHTDGAHLGKAGMIVCGIYAFYLMERLLHMGSDNLCCRRRSKASPGHGSNGHGSNGHSSNGHSHHHHHHHIASAYNGGQDDGAELTLWNSRDHSVSFTREASVFSASNVQVRPLLTPVESNGHNVLVTSAAADAMAALQPKNLSRKKKQSDGRVAPAAYVILIGHAFHNLVQGMSIGAAFTSSTILGVSISLAIICEEIPHGLGDFAILLNAGMTKQKAVLFNFLSGCPGFLGLVVGIKLAEVAHATPWILGIAGGIFLYIGLADMLPEMNAALEDNEDRTAVVFLVQNAGLLLGIGAMAALAVYSQGMGLQH